MRPFSQLLTATALVVLASGVACKNDSGVTGPTSLEGQYRGTVAGESSPSLSASLAVTVAPSATGTITPVGAAAITMTGTYVASTKADCGTYTGGADGVWNTLIRGSSLSGVYDNVDGSDGYFTGTVNGNSVSITEISASPGATASGTISGTTMSGTLSGNGVVYATWTSDTSC